MTDLDFNRQVNQISALLKSLSLNFTKDAVTAQDLQQETLLRAYKHRNRFREGTNFKSWVSTIMRNVFINQYRRAKVRRAISHVYEPNDTNMAGSATAYNAGIQSLVSNDILTAIDQLNALYRIPFLLFYQGYQYQEIADQLNLPIGTVKSRIFHARTQLKRALRQYA